MFTKKQIEEIASRLASAAVKDSQFEDISYPFNSTESIPLLQDGQNKLITLADLRSLVLENNDQTQISCTLIVECSTPGAKVYIKGRERSEYIAHYGEIVDIIITKQGYDTFFELVTMTQNHTFSVYLNETGGSGPTPPTPVTTKFNVTVFNNQGATITFSVGGESYIVPSGETRQFDTGTSVRINVAKEGYKSYNNTVTSTFNETITLAEEGEQDPYLRFSSDSLRLNSDGDSNSSVSVVSNVAWVIQTQTLPTETGDEHSEDNTAADNLPVTYDTVYMREGDEIDTSSLIS